MKIIELYKSILSIANLKSDSEGAISIVYGNDSVPMTQKGKRWVLPTNDQLKHSDWDNRMVFHPLSENISRSSESDVMQRYRKSINTRFNYVLSCIMEDLMVLATSTKLHKNLTPDQTDLLNVLKDADERTLTALKTIIKNAQAEDKNDGIIHLFLKKSGMISGTKFNRACIVTFPLWEALNSNSKSVYGATLRIKDRDSIKGLLKYIFNQIDEPEAYNRGSNSDIAPYLDALMSSVKKIVTSINDLTELFYKHLTNASEYMFSVDWVESFEDINLLYPEIRLIPMQAGNEGNLTPKAVPQQPAPVLSTPQPIAQQQTMPPVNNPYQPAVPQAPQVVRTNSGKVDFNASMNALRPNQPYNGYGQPPQSVFNSQPSWGGPVGYNPMQPQYGYQQPVGYQQPYNQYPQQSYNGPVGIV